MVAQHSTAQHKQHKTMSAWHCSFTNEAEQCDCIWLWFEIFSSIRIWKCCSVWYLWKGFSSQQHHVFITFNSYDCRWKQHAKLVAEYANVFRSVAIVMNFCDFESCCICSHCIKKLAGNTAEFIWCWSRCVCSNSLWVMDPKNVSTFFAKNHRQSGGCSETAVASRSHEQKT